MPNVSNFKNAKNFVANPTFNTYVSDVDHSLGETKKAMEKRRRGVKILLLGAW
jgi:hypothetical protein